ncbi:Chemotaxis protein CheC -- inhibitor of MCP methylation [Desulfovibrio sp. DV]|uniref:chemotaxis protein CheC n=1 Tax=Desulfovibrio sp. DV TaxID=1844708 RepID=UPI00094BC1C8|nr:chemotaxis protein CheC [Desulfovibrio sp. DV]OLN27983.1 Chemotaxis protein CheC -- inhibitor of MCP methylation [Desulfovibrio sp. DV]
MTSAISLEARMDLLSECVNIGLGRAAEALNRMCDSHVKLSAPEIRIMSRPTLTAATAGRCPSRCEGVFLPFTGPMMGMTALAFAYGDAAKLTSGLTADMGIDDPSEAMRDDTLREVGNVILVGVLGAMGTVLGLHVVYQPLTTAKNLDPLLAVADSCNTVTLYVRAHFSLERFMVTGDIMVVLAQEGFDALMAAIDAKILEMTG